MHEIKMMNLLILVISLNKIDFFKKFNIKKLDQIFQNSNCEINKTTDKLHT